MGMNVGILTQPPGNAHVYTYLAIIAGNVSITLSAAADHEDIEPKLKKEVLEL